MKRRKAKEQAKLENARLPTYPALDMTLREFVNKFHYSLLMLCLVICLIPILILGLNSLSLITIVTLVSILNAFYTGIKNERDSNGMGSWDCASILKRLLYGILWGYIIFSLSVIFMMACYVTNSSNLFSNTGSTDLGSYSPHHYFQSKSSEDVHGRN